MQPKSRIICSQYVPENILKHFVNFIYFSLLFLRINSAFFSSYSYFSIQTSRPKTNIAEETTFKASGTAAPLGDQKTFAYNTIDADEVDHKAVIINDPDEAEKLMQQGAAGDKGYKGMANYTKYVEKKESNIKYVLNVFSIYFSYQYANMLLFFVLFLEWDPSRAR